MPQYLIRAEFREPPNRKGRRLSTLSLPGQRQAEHNTVLSHRKDAAEGGLSEQTSQVGRMKAIRRFSIMKVPCNLSKMTLKERPLQLL